MDAEKVWSVWQTEFGVNQSDYYQLEENKSSFSKSVTSGGTNSANVPYFCLFFLFIMLMFFW